MRSICFNYKQFKNSDDCLYAVGESLLTTGYQGMLWSIRVYRRNHCVPSGTYKRSAPTADRLPEIPEINCYPNPFNRNLKIIINDSRSFMLSIYDIKGKKIWTYKNNKEKIGNKTIIWIPDENIRTGIYIIKYYNSQSMTTKKVLFIK